MPSFLELEAYLGGAFLHPGGRVTTDVLIDALRVRTSDTVLDLGCGVGGTAVMLAGQTGARVVALDASAMMLRRARAAAPSGASLCWVRADARATLPFQSDSFDAAYAESVVALLDPDFAISELARVLRPGGRLVLNERIWKPGTSAASVRSVNVRSLRALGIPAAAEEPRDVSSWLCALSRRGFDHLQVTPVDDLLAVEPHGRAHSARPLRAARYLARPSMLAHSMRAKWMMRRYVPDWSLMECYLFTARRSESPDASRADHAGV
ncbi:MAG TPA: methyltransferase domain-containing protein [Thermomicrobiales bacterium]|nr:methyltransferase domain-containing protein [Thermomicrobiales bacterium]